MVVFRCGCGYTWIIDLEAAKIIGPIYADNVREDKLFIGNGQREISMGAFRDMYADCWSQLKGRIVPKS